jgi:hypothetical protein
MDFSEIVLSEELFSRLKESAELGDVTELEKTLDEVRQMGEVERLLAEQILTFSRNFDMKAILNVLSEIPK